MQFHFNDSSPSLSLIYRGFGLHCQHYSFLDPSCNFAVLCMIFLKILQVTLTTWCSTIIVTLLQVFIVTFAALCCTFSMILPDPSCNFRGFVHDFSQGPLINSHGSVQHYWRLFEYQPYMWPSLRKPSLSVHLVYREIPFQNIEATAVLLCRVLVMLDLQYN